MKPGSLLILIVVLVMSIFTLLILALNRGNFKTSNQKTPIEKSSEIQVSRAASEGLNLDDYIVFEVPSNFVQLSEVKAQSDIKTFESNDITRTESGRINQGLILTVGISNTTSEFKDDPFSFIVSPFEGYKKEELLADGRNSVAYHGGFEGTYNYHVAIFDKNNDITVHFIFDTKDSKKEAVYKNTIDSILSSVKFKQ